MAQAWSSHVSAPRAPPRFDGSKAENGRAGKGGRAAARVVGNGAAFAVPASPSVGADHVVGRAAAAAAGEGEENDLGAGGGYSTFAELNPPELAELALGVDTPGYVSDPTGYQYR